MNTDVNEVVESDTTEGATEIAQESEDKTEETPQEVAGSKTDSALLLESLREEREKRRELEQKLQEKELDSPEVFSDEGKALQKQILALQEEIKLKDALAKFPALKDKTDEFAEFKKSYPGVGTDQVAKLFLSENNLIEAPAPRKGLEKTTGGSRIAPKTGISKEDVESLRTTNFRKYMQMVKDGKLDDIS